MTIERSLADRSTRLETYYAGLAQRDVAPLWTLLDRLLPAEPISRAMPHVWHYRQTRELLMEAGELVSASDAERRVLMLMNPGLEGEPAAATNLYAGIQLVLPGEHVPAHRHAAAAVRFVIEGDGAFTTVDGERTTMAPGDLVLTPNSAWHSHGNDSGTAMVWLDGLDVPFVNAVEANYYEQEEGHEKAKDKPDDASRALYAHGRLSPRWLGWNEAYSPMINYPWSFTERVLRESAEVSPGSPYDGVLFEYTNPSTGGSVLPTLGCYVQQLAPGQHTEAHRHTTSAVYQVVGGRGTTIVDGKALAWERNDTFAVPGWTMHEHVNGSDYEAAVLFSFTDDPILRSLALYREQPAISLT